MLEFILSIITLITIYEYEHYYKTTHDYSIQGFIEYMKNKYYYKEENKTQPTQKNGAAHSRGPTNQRGETYEEFKARRMREQQEKKP